MSRPDDQRRPRESAAVIPTPASVKDSTERNGEARCGADVAADPFSARVLDEHLADRRARRQELEESITAKLATIQRDASHLWMIAAAAERLGDQEMADAAHAALSVLSDLVDEVLDADAILQQVGRRLAAEPVDEIPDPFAIDDDELDGGAP